MFPLHVSLLLIRTYGFPGILNNIKVCVLSGFPLYLFISKLIKSTKLNTNYSIRLSTLSTLILVLRRVGHFDQINIMSKAKGN